jgi:two-component system chemotaxis response regulator CheY
MARVLVADDSVFVRTQIVNLVQALGHETAEAADGAEAVSVFERWHPDLVLLDITMPEMDGLEALRRILGTDPEAVVVMVSARAANLVVMDALSIGARDFLSKPVDPDKLAQIIESRGRPIDLPRLHG